ncbi:hypothetical protein ACFL1E_06680 [Candidatus Omnitrophota bacterium]
MKKCVAITLVLIAVLVGTFAFYDVKQSEAKSMLTIDADNKICPVTGAKITVKRFNTSYGSKRYWFSSFAAVKEFKSDPEKYVRNLERLQRGTTSRSRTTGTTSRSRTTGTTGRTGTTSRTGTPSRTGTTSRRGY